MLNVLITGHKGYLGSILSERLAANNQVNLIGFDNCIYDKELSDKIKTDDFRQIDFAKLGKVDVIIHLAGLSTNYDPPEKIYSDLAMEINYEATMRFAVKAKEAGVKKFIFASSASVYGDSDTDRVNEDSKPNPLTSYAKSKLYAEEGLLKLNDEFFSTVILRMVTLFGLSERMRFDVIVNNLILSSLVNNKIVLQSDGMATRPQVHVRDVCKVYEALVTGDYRNANGQIINIGREDYNVTVLSIAERLSEVLKCEIVLGKEKTVDKRSYHVDFTRQQTIFPEIIFDHDFAFASREIKGFFDRMTDNGKWYENPVYYNLKQMKAVIDQGRVTDDLSFI